MKATLLSVLLACSLAYGQKFQDVSAKGSPISLSVKHDYADMGPYAVGRNNSEKAILAMVSVVRTTDDRGRSLPCMSYMDYAFKMGVLAPHEERFVCLLEASDPGSKVASEEGAVLFVQFDDGTTWGDVGAGKELLKDRPQKLAFLKRLVERYYESGEEAFDAALSSANLQRPERMVANCLVGDAKELKMTTIDLAKKRLAAALEWHAQGIF